MAKKVDAPKDEDVIDTPKDEDVIDTPKDEVSSDLVVLVAPEGCYGCSFDGVSYDADEDGFVMVPKSAVRDLKSHGFTEFFGKRG